MVKLEKPPLIEFYNDCIVVNFSIKYYRGINGIGKEYETYNYKYFAIGVRPKWFEIINWWYDGHWSKGIVICGMLFEYTDTFIYELL